MLGFKEPEMSEHAPVTLDTIVSLAKRRGFVFPTSTIYSGLANSYEYGPLGVELLRNIKNLWWREFITKRPDMVGLDSQIILHPKTWVASGHVTAFNDPLVEDTITHKRYRADHLIEGWAESAGVTIDVASMNLAQMNQYITEHTILSPEGNVLSEAKAFNLLFETEIGAVSGEKSKVYLRGETAQGIFRTLEFEQAEIEYFFDPEASDWHELMESWKTAMWNFVTKQMGIDETKLRWRKHSDSERSHYSKDTYDLEYLFPFGWKELWGIAYRTDYDLTQHMKLSGESLEVVDSATGRKFIPHVIEPAVGVNRLFLMALVDSYREEPEKERIVLSLNPTLAPNQVAVFPLLKNKPELVQKAQEVFHALLAADLRVVWDDRGNIGKRYLSQDEAGTPYCVTVDFETLENETVTIRHRDTAEQKRVTIGELASYVRSTR